MNKWKCIFLIKDNLVWAAFGVWICASIMKSRFKNTLEVKDVFPQVDCMFFFGLLDVELMISKSRCLQLPKLTCWNQNADGEGNRRVSLAVKQEDSSSCYVRNSNSNFICQERLIYYKFY